MGDISRNCPNRDVTGGSSSRQVTFVVDRGKGHVNLVKIKDKTRKMALVNFEQSLHNEVNVMAAKQMQE